MAEIDEGIGDEEGEFGVEGAGGVAEVRRAPRAVRTRVRASKVKRVMAGERGSALIVAGGWIKPGSGRTGRARTVRSEYNSVAGRWEVHYACAFNSFRQFGGIVAFCGLGFPAVAASQEVSEVVDKARAAPPRCWRISSSACWRAGG